jgi:cytochrome b subunit of formate dehydrogenase
MLFYKIRKGDYPRYSIHIVIQHLLMAVTFAVLVITGIPLKYYDAQWAYWLNSALGGITVTRVIHRVAACVMMFSGGYHLMTIIIGPMMAIWRKRFNVRRTMIPLPKDLVDFVQDIEYFLGLRSTRPAMEKFCYKQKLHYLAAFWGNTVLIASGLTLWFPEKAVHILPHLRLTVDIFRLLHSDEAVLAMLTILVWHLYNVHLAPGRFPIQWLFLTGRITKDHLIEEHFLEYQRLVKEGDIREAEPTEDAE